MVGRSKKFYDMGKKKISEKVERANNLRECCRMDILQQMTEMILTY